MNETIYTVGEISGKIKLTLESFGSVNVRGEISNLTNHSSGHKYFSIKDENAQISCVMWRSRRLTHELSNGMKVVVSGRLSVYPPRGSYQIDCVSVSPEGEGDLYLAYKALFEKLEKKGYFDEEHKLPVPAVPLRIGIATSPTGAAYQDMLKTIERRMPACEILFRSTLCQGESAAADIVAAISDFQDTEVDVLIIGRGGGSLEDLWPFNEEIVADAIYNSKIPIISAVGHEPDFTISDFVADKRAATPTASGELVTPITLDDFLRQFDLYSDRMNDIVSDRILYYRDRLKQFLTEYSVRRFLTGLREKNQYLDDLQTRMNTLTSRNFKNLRAKLEQKNSHFLSLNPKTPLDRGFALLRRESGEYLGNADSLKKGETVIIERRNEEAETEIKKINKR